LEPEKGSEILVEEFLIICGGVPLFLEILGAQLEEMKKSKA
jgi:hypothetical protein